MTMMRNGEMEQLIGIWKSDPEDETALESYGRVTLEFKASGSLIYTIHESDRDNMMLLTFREGEPGFIITDQPSAPHPERTAYEITPDGKLILVFGGEKSRYVRVTECYGDSD